MRSMLHLCLGVIEICGTCALSDEEYDPSTHLSFSEITVVSHDKTSVITLKIKASKTDLFMQGVTIYLGATGMKLCPVKSLLA